MKELLILFGRGSRKLVNTNEAHGVRIEGDDILVPSRLRPIFWEASRASKQWRSHNRDLRLGGKQADVGATPQGQNYLYHPGGVRRFATWSSSISIRRIRSNSSWLTITGNWSQATRRIRLVMGCSCTCGTTGKSGPYTDSEWCDLALPKLIRRRPWPPK
jgi:hypothetical protein